MSRSRTRCYIGRLKEGAVSTRDMENLFGKFGRITDIQLKGSYGFVEYDSDRSADDAVLHMNRTEFMGDRIVVEHARDDTKLKRTAPPPGRGRSPSPTPRYGDSMSSQRPGLFGGPAPSSGGSYSNYAAPPQPAYSSNPYSQYSSVARSAYPPEPLPPYRSYGGPEPYPHDPLLPQQRAWSPPRGSRRRSRSRSRSPISKRHRRSSPLRISRRRSRSRSRSPVRSPRDSSRPSKDQFSEKTTARSPWRICVENLTPLTTWQDLRRHFDEIGQVVYASVASDASGFVEFVRRDMVSQAIEKLNNTYLKGVRILVMNSIRPEDDEVPSNEADAEASEAETAKNGNGKATGLLSGGDRPFEAEEETEVIPHANGLDDEEPVNEVVSDYAINGNGLDQHEGETEAVAIIGESNGH